MDQNLKTPARDEPIQASFQQKSAGVSLVVIFAIGIYFFMRAFQMAPAGAGWPAGYGWLAAGVIVAIIIAESALQITLVIGAGQAAARTRHERQAELRASRNAYAVLAVGAMAVFGGALFGLNVFALANLVLFSFWLAELARLASFMIYARAGSVD